MSITGSPRQPEAAKERLVGNVGLLIEGKVDRSKRHEVVGFVIPQKGDYPSLVPN